jgi:hypothetical protein
VLDCIVVDLLAVLEEPDWPAAGFTLYVLAKAMVSGQSNFQLSRCNYFVIFFFSVFQMATIDDRSTTAEANMVRATSIDHLGVIGARLCRARANLPDKGGWKSTSQVIKVPVFRYG